MSEPLPKFTKPPVVEMVLGVQFDPIAAFRNSHLGAYWSTLGEEWADVTDATPIHQQMERFGEDIAWGNLEFDLRLIQNPAVRMMVRNRIGDRMIQLQNGRFHCNWLGHDGGEYPHYDSVRAEFDRLWEKFLSFLEVHKLPVPALNQWEVTYVNHIKQGTVWNTPADWMKLFPSLPQAPATLGEVVLEAFNGEWHYEIPPERGRLHVQINHVRDSKKQNVLRLSLTGRGSIMAKSDAGLDAGLKLGHETIVRSFKRLTSTDAHEYWGLVHHAENAV